MGSFIYTGFDMAELFGCLERSGSRSVSEENRIKKFATCYQRDLRGMVAESGGALARVEAYAVCGGRVLLRIAQCRLCSPQVPSVTASTNARYIPTSIPRRAARRARR